MFPTVIATRQAASSSNQARGGRTQPTRVGGVEDLDFYIGDEAIANSR